MWKIVSREEGKQTVWGTGHDFAHCLMCAQYIKNNNKSLDKYFVQDLDSGKEVKLLDFTNHYNVKEVV